MSKGAAIPKAKFKIPKGWQVRPLVFSSYEDGSGNYWRSNTRYARDYRIDPPSDIGCHFKLTLWIDSPVNVCRDFDSFEAAVADAQRDFETFIASAFTCS